MATILPRKKKNGTTSYTAVIRLTIDGKKYSQSKTFKTKKIASIWAGRRESELREPGMADKVHHRGTTIKMVLEWYMEDFNGLSKFGRSKLSHIQYLINHDDFSSLDAVNLTVQDLIKHAYSRNASPSTVNNDFVWLRNAIKTIRISRDMPLNLQAVDDAMYLLRKEKVIGKSKQRSRRPTIHELNKLLDALADRDYRSSIPMVDVVLFALFSTRRQEEVVRIRWDDLDRERGGVLVRDMKHPTEKIDTFCHLSDRAWDIIDRQPKTDLEIFPYNGKSVSAAFTRTCSLLGIEDLRFHDLRHEGISWLFETGLPLQRVAMHSGHKSWAALQRYTHLTEIGEKDRYEGWRWLNL